MPRPHRLDHPGITLHVVQRGNNRQSCFFRNHDYRFYLDRLGELLAELDCALHAYVLMTNHVHMMLTPARAGTVSRLMQSLGRSYVRFINASLERTGTLWEGRFKSCPVDGAGYALACIRYIELNPVRAGMVATPRQYRWSSVHASAFGDFDSLVTPHPAFEGLALETALRRDRYRELLVAGLAQDELDDIRLHAARQRAWGSEGFSAALEAATGEPATIRKRGPALADMTEKLLL
jgi:putative transposase